MHWTIIIFYLFGFGKIQASHTCKKQAIFIINIFSIKATTGNEKKFQFDTLNTHTGEWIYMKLNKSVTAIQQQQQQNRTLIIIINIEAAGHHSITTTTELIKKRTTKKCWMVAVVNDWKCIDHFYVICWPWSSSMMTMIIMVLILKQTN